MVAAELLRNGQLLHLDVVIYGWSLSGNFTVVTEEGGCFLLRFHATRMRDSRGPYEYRQLDVPLLYTFMVPVETPVSINACGHKLEAEGRELWFTPVPTSSRGRALKRATSKSLLL